MDLHPAGLPHLVGPEGFQFPQADYSHSFRYLPNNVVSELPPPNVEQLSMMRSHPNPLKVRAAPSSPRGAVALHPLRLSMDTSRPGTLREQLPSSPSRHLLTSGTTPVAALSNPNPPPSAITPAAIPPAEVTIAAAETVVVHQGTGSLASKES
ncbi:hypothetical protein GOP47_0006834 [Adiantum capillus-veneris]|uniref:Uncharacterized protein n=1 Tax=Adiantum capillus-veneris TaxID=13818 RepID=A0A9D4ZKM6_ADICA|nr:hypothetical protein GOP47_0006834 [Adiantum capillus-veneris]